MSYLASPAVALLASQCACCARDLVDATSIETGIGPVCREKHGYGTAEGPCDMAAALVAIGSTIPVDEVAAWGDAHRAANALVYRIAVDQRGAAVEAWTRAIGLLGYTTLAERIAVRLYGRRGAEDRVAHRPTIEVRTIDGILAVTSPYSAEGVAALRGVPGRRWDGQRNVFPASSLPALLWALRVGYAGHEATLPDGEVVELSPVADGEKPPVIAAPVAQVTVTVDGGALLVRSPYSPAATEAFRAVHGRRWDGTAKGWRFPLASKYEVKAALAQGYPGATVAWPRDMFPASPDAAAMEAQFGIEMDPAYA